MSINHVQPRGRSGVDTDLGGQPAMVMTPGAPQYATLAPRDVLAVLRRHFLLIAAVTVGSVAVAAHLARATPIYRATALVRLADTRGSITEGIEGTPRLASQRTNPLLTQVQLLRSRSLIGQIVDPEGLRIRSPNGLLPSSLLAAVKVNDPATNGDSLTLAFSATHVAIAGSVPPVRARYGETLRAPAAAFVVTARPNTDTATIFVTSHQQAIDWVLDRLRIAPREETDVVEVSFTHSDPARAQRVVNALVRSYQAANAEAARARARRRREFLEEQLRVVSPQLAQAERELTGFRSQHEIFESGNRLQAEQAALMTLDMRRHEFEADRSMYQALLTALEQRKPGDDVRSTLSTADVGTNPLIVQLYQQLAQYQARRDSLTTGQWRSAPTNPDVSRLDTLVAVTERRLVDAVRGHISLLDARVTALGALRDRSTAAIQRLPRAQSTEERLARQVEASRTLVDDMRAEYQKAKMAEAVEVGQVEIVDLAALPYRAEPGLGTLKLGAGLMFGLVFGVGGAFLREHTNARIRRRGELESDLRVPVLSIIPRMYSPTALESPSRLAAMLRGKADERARATLVAPKSPADAEAYRVLRTNLRWVSDGPDAPKTLVVTSAMTREGKSLISANLALAFALEGRRTVLVDCDLRRAKLHRVFGLPRSPGLAHLLHGDITAAAAIRSTFLPDLFFLPAGRLISLPSDLLGVNRTRRVLGELSSHFDVVILDTPPVLSVADASIIAAESDGVLLVVRAGETDREAVNQTLRQLDVVGARVLGAVLNDPRGEVKRYGDYYATTDYDAVGD